MLSVMVTKRNFLGVRNLSFWLDCAKYLRQNWGRLTFKEMSHSTSGTDDGFLSTLDEGSCEESLESGPVLKKGPWTPAEDAILVDYVKKHGEGNWNSVQKNSGLFRCGKSCRLRWANHLRPNLKKGAFTAEEERLIIELHCKMGNKWARMAAHLPGRTDNEIKNYWNTRIKRRQRAGLPLYPPELSSEPPDETCHDPNRSSFAAGDSQRHNLLQESNYEIPDVTFDNLKATQGILSYPTTFPDISGGSSMLSQGLVPSQNKGFMPRPKRLRESENLFPGFNGCIPSGVPPMYMFQSYTGEKTHRSFGLPHHPYDPDPDPNYRSFPPLCGKSSNLVPLNGNISASKPNPGAVKLELPSFQYAADTDFGSWETTSPPPTSFESVDAFIQSPSSNEHIQSDCLSPHNSGLLEALLHESHTPNQTPKKVSSLSVTTTSGLMDGSSAPNPCETEFERFRDPISPLGRSAASVFCVSTPMSENSCNEAPAAEAEAEALPGSNIKVEPDEHARSTDYVKDRENSTQIDISSRPDALLGSCWFDRSYENGKDQFMSDAIASLLAEDLSTGYKDMSAETSSSITQGWELSSIPWNNMPAAVCRMQHDLP